MTDTAKGEIDAQMTKSTAFPSALHWLVFGCIQAAACSRHTHTEQVATHCFVSTRTQRNKWLTNCRCICAVHVVPCMYWSSKNLHTAGRALCIVHCPSRCERHTCLVPSIALTMAVNNSVSVFCAAISEYFGSLLCDATHIAQNTGFSMLLLLLLLLLFFVFRSFVCCSPWWL